MKKKILSIIVFSLLMTGCDSKENNQPPKQPPLNVSYIQVHEKDLPIEEDFSGRIVAFMTSDIRPQIGGIIQKRLFTEGQSVKSGDVLYQIDPSTYQATYNESLANLGQLQSTLSLASLKANRYSMLIKNASVSQQDYDDARSSYQQAKYNVAAAKATLENAKINLERTKVKAPISGQIGISSVTPGSLVTAEQTDALSTIRYIDKVYVDFTQTSIDLLKLKKYLLENKQDMSDKAVNLYLEDGTEYGLKGKLLSTEVSVDEGTGTVTLRAEFDNPDHLLLPGAFARVRLSQYESKAILLPQQAVIRTGDGKTQAYIIKENKAKLVSIEVKNNIGDSWVVTKGINDNDKVITEGLSKLKDGQEVSTSSDNVNKKGDI